MGIFSNPMMSGLAILGIAYTIVLLIGSSVLQLLPDHPRSKKEGEQMSLLGLALIAVIAIFVINAVISFIADLSKFH